MLPVRWHRCFLAKYLLPLCIFMLVISTTVYEFSYLLFLLADRSGLKPAMAMYTTLDCLFHGFEQQKDTQR